jgi:hypothetical protein
MEAAATGTCEVNVVVVDVEVAEGVGVPVDVAVDVAEGVGVPVDVAVDVAEGVGVPVDVEVDVAEGVGVPVDVEVDAPVVLEELLVHPDSVTLANNAAMPRTWNSAFIIFLPVSGHTLPIDAEACSDQTEFLTVWKGSQPAHDGWSAPFALSMSRQLSRLPLAHGAMGASAAGGYTSTAATA